MQGKKCVLNVQQQKVGLKAGLRIRIRSDPECFARIRIRNVLPGSGSGIIIPDPDPTLEKKKVGSFNIFTLKEGGGELTGSC